MQLAEPAPGATAVTVGPSFALDLSWSIHAASRDYLRERYPELGALYEEHPGLSQRVNRFWGDGLACFTELEILALRGGVLDETEPPRVLAAVLAQAERGGTPSLASESAQDEKRVHRRLDRLADDASLRRRYKALLEEIADAIGEPWTSVRLPAVLACADAVRARLKSGTRWVELVAAGCETFAAHRDKLVAAVDDGAPLSLIVCAYFGIAQYLNVDGAVVVGVGVERDDLAARARTEVLARKLRVLADPTRLAIVDYLAPAPHSVGEIAAAFHLAQPTVSNHLKALREAGLVVAERVGGRLSVRVDRHAVAMLGERLRAVGDAASGGDEAP